MREVSSTTSAPECKVDGDGCCGSGVLVQNCMQYNRHWEGSMSTCLGYDLAGNMGVLCGGGGSTVVTYGLGT